ncbi:MAG: DUF169 domain-containing protein [Acidobacteriota bacterium]|nr:DUF169 domain-containing protein [Acidobacteriota bacterium]
MPQMALDGSLLRDLLGDGTDAVAVFLLPPGQQNGAFATFESVRGHRYCQALMKARHGESVLLEPAGLSCPAAAAAFGFRPLPPQLANGKGLVGFGIVAEAAVGEHMFAAMPRLADASIGSIALCPLRLAPRIPDVVVVEGSAEVLMWLLLADLNVHGGTRRTGSTAVLQATCVDATVIPHVEQRLNFGLGCYGCREATDLAPGETVLGFPGALLDPLLGALEMLRAKAVPRSRAKLAHACLAETTETSNQENHIES